MTEEYTKGYRDGFKDGFQAGSKSDEILVEKKPVEPIILDNNPLSIACYLEEHPEIDIETNCPLGETSPDFHSSIKQDWDKESKTKKWLKDKKDFDKDKFNYALSKSEELK